MDFGDVDALFVGKIETWDEIKNDLPKDMPLISFPTYKGFSNITKGYQWFDFINKFEPLMEPNVPKLSIYGQLYLLRELLVILKE